MPSSKEILKYISGLERLGVKPGLGRIRRLLSALGNPQNAYPCVHVAGTNGKGSTSAMLASILTAAGYRTGLYTSPHLVRFNERIRIDGVDIGDKDLARIGAGVKDAAQGLGPSFFEFTTAIAFDYFRERKVDAAVIETGMGGRLDATNVLRPKVSIITNVDFDHMEFLGKSLARIACEKAGIIKPGIATVTAEDKKEALSIIEKNALKKGSALLRLGEDFSYRARPAKKERLLDYIGMKRRFTGLGLSLTGPHQLKNASCALAAVELLAKAGFKISECAVRKGIKTAFWPARLEVVGKRPLVMIDAAHNPAGAAALKIALEGLCYDRLILVIGIMKDKDVDGFLRTITPLADVVIFTAPGTARAMDVEGLLNALALPGKTVLSRKGVKGALKTAIAIARPKDAVCVAGSIFTAGEAIRALATRGILR